MPRSAGALVRRCALPNPNLECFWRRLFNLLPNWALLRFTGYDGWSQVMLVTLVRPTGQL